VNEPPRKKPENATLEPIAKSLVNQVTVIVVTYNSSAVIESCIYALGSAIRVIVVDNASLDDTCDRVARCAPWAECIRQTRNEGYGRAANRGLAEVKTPYALLLNPDVNATPSKIQALLDVANAFPLAAITAPETEETLIKKSGGKVVCCDWVVGAVMLFNMTNLQKVGRFDPSFFLFYEETDLCRRIRDAGLEIRKSQTLIFPHDVGKSSGNQTGINWLKNWHLAWSRCFYEHKHGDSSITAYSLYWKYGWKWLSYIVCGNQKKTLKYQARLAGIRAFLRGQQAFSATGNPNGIMKEKTQ